MTSYGGRTGVLDAVVPAVGAVLEVPADRSGHGTPKPYPDCYQRSVLRDVKGA